MNRNTKFIPFSRPVMGTDEENAVLSVIRSGWLTTGPIVGKFEQEFAAFTGAKNAFAVNSATAGLHLSLEALNIKPGDLVATTPYTFIASSEILNYLGAEPLFIDIERDSYNIDPYLLEKTLKLKKLKTLKMKKRGKRRVAAILPVHIAGLPCSMDHLLEISDAYKIPIVEDAAHAFPVKIKNRYAGTLGAAGVYSFYANKTITTGEGGMIVTDREDIAKRIKIMRFHGINLESWDRYNSLKATWEYKVIEAGFKYNMTDIAAAMGRVQLKKAQSFLEKRKKVAQTYIKELSDCDFLTLPDFSEDHAWHLFLLRLNKAKLTISRDEFIMNLKKQGIGTSVHYIPLHIMPYYKKRYAYKSEDFPISYENFTRSLSLPIYPSLSEHEINYIIETIKNIGYSNYNIKYK